jgi:transposase
MLGRQERWQEELFVAGPLRDLIPEDHILRRVDRVLDLSWLRDEVRDCYDLQRGRPGIDPESAVRLMLAGLFCGITQDRQLLREAQVNLAIRWFAGYRLHERLPDHSSLTRIRQRWGAERFGAIFRRSVAACGRAGLVDGGTVHVDASLIRADVSWESLIERHAEAVLRDNPPEPDDPPPAPRRGRTPAGLAAEPPAKKYSPTDPEATLSTSCKQYRMEPCYKQHTVVDDCAGVIVDVAVTTGEASEGLELAGQLARVEAQTGVAVQTVTADGAYAHGRNFEHLEQRGTVAVIPPQAERRTAPRIPARRFKYDARHRCVRCPGRRVLRPSTRNAQGWVYRARAADCRVCPLQARCIARSANARVIVIGDGYEALLRARRKRRRWSSFEHGLYARHRWRAEGVHGEAKTRHGLRRAARRGLWNVAIQAYLTAAVMNWKRLAAFCRAPRATAEYSARPASGGVAAPLEFALRAATGRCLRRAA